MISIFLSLSPLLNSDIILLIKVVTLDEPVNTGIPVCVVLLFLTTWSTFAKLAVIACSNTVAALPVVNVWDWINSALIYKYSSYVKILCGATPVPDLTSATPPSPSSYLPPHGKIPGYVLEFSALKSLHGPWLPKRIL